MAITAMFTALRCTKDYGPVKQYMESLARKLENDRPNPLLHAFRGISNFSSDAKEVQLLLIILAQKLQRTTVSIEPDALATGLYARSMKADNMPAKLLLGSLVTKIRESTACFGPREITSMISPCRSLGDDSATFDLMRYKVLTEVFSVTTIRISNSR